MNKVDFLLGLILLLIGFAIGYHEAQNGITFEDFKKFYILVVKKLKKKEIPSSGGANIY